MAVVTFTYQEFLDTLKANNLLPEQIVRAEVKNDCFHFAVRTDTFILPYVPASLRYVDYENNIARFDLVVVSPHFNKALGWFGHHLQSKLPDYVTLDLPYVLFDLEKIFEEKKIKGVSIKEIIHEPYQFTFVLETK